MAIVLVIPANGLIPKFMQDIYGFTEPFLIFWIFMKKPL